MVVARSSYLAFVAFQFQFYFNIFWLNIHKLYCLVLGLFTRWYLGYFSPLKIKGRAFWIHCVIQINISSIKMWVFLSRCLYLYKCELTPCESVEIYYHVIYAYIIIIWCSHLLLHLLYHMLLLFNVILLFISVITIASSL